MKINQINQKMKIILVIENCLWKSNFGTFWGLKNLTNFSPTPKYKLSTNWIQFQKNRHKKMDNFYLDTAGVDELFVSNKDIKEVVEIYEKFYRTWTTIAERLFQNRQHHHYPSSKIAYCKVPNTVFPLLISSAKIQFIT